MRPATREQVESFGANFLVVEDDEFKNAQAAGGYAKKTVKALSRGSIGTGRVADICRASWTFASCRPVTMPFCSHVRRSSQRICRAFVPIRPASTEQPFAVIST